MARSVGAKLVDMKSVQVHPTAFIDPKHPHAETKTLCAEILRGSGAVLLDQLGERFVDELEKRDVVTKHMVDRAIALGAHASDQPRFHLVLNQAGASVADKHLAIYTRKGLLTMFDGIDELAGWMGILPSTLRATMGAVSYTHLRAHETPEHLVCRLLLEKKKKLKKITYI
eukprot:TRINITY_DN31260_c0_g1_i1.p1 TRINITY_DN31260_c0_g1~~TRINITY_DN31260_c0_g1_i1.p1  ORF type:complete len:171 (+),score=50.37 TRINITY_DN31260_c0_g1_i1:648-1160(+)